MTKIAIFDFSDGGRFDQNGNAFSIRSENVEKHSGCILVNLTNPEVSQFNTHMCALLVDKHMSTAGSLYYGSFTSYPKEKSNRKVRFVNFFKLAMGNFKNQSQFFEVGLPFRLWIFRHSPRRHCKSGNHIHTYIYIYTGLSARLNRILTRLQNSMTAIALFTLIHTWQMRTITRTVTAAIERHSNGKTAYWKRYRIHDRHIKQSVHWFHYHRRSVLRSESRKSHNQ